MAFLRFLLGFALALMLIYLLVENSHILIEFSFFGTKYQNMPLWIMIFIVFIVGFASSSLVGLMEIARLRYLLFKAERKIKDMEKELDELRKFVLEEEEGN